MPTYPGLYRAKAVKVSPLEVTAIIPQVFGDTSVVITDFLGTPAPGMGWTFFQAGDADHPVWCSGLGGAGGGTVTDTLWVGPDPPTDPSIEMWYDTDEANTFASTADYWNSAWGVVAAAATTPANLPLTTAYATVASVTTTLVANRRYSINFSARALDVSVATNSVFTTLFKDGVEISLSDKYTIAAPPVNYGGGASYRWMIVGDGVSHTYSVQAKTSAGTGMFHCQPEGGASAFTIEDIGPVTRQPSSFTPPTTDWSPWDARYISTTPPAWTALPLDPTWVNFGTGYMPAGYRKIGDIVYLRGLVKPLSGAANMFVGTLPSGFRPPFLAMWTAWLSGNSGSYRAAVRFEVTAAGVVQIGSLGFPTGTTNPAISAYDHVNLDQIQFSVTP